MLERVFLMVTGTIGSTERISAAYRILHRPDHKRADVVSAWMTLVRIIVVNGQRQSVAISSSPFSPENLARSFVLKSFATRSGGYAAKIPSTRRRADDVT